MYGQCFEHYSEIEYFNKQKEFDILPIKMKFYLNIIEEKDILTSVTCSVKPTFDSFRNCFFYRTMKRWNFLPYDLRQDVKLSRFKRKLILWASDTDWPD